MKASLRDIPEVDFATARVQRNPFAARAQKAVAALRRAASRSGVAKLSDAEIAQEIAAARRERRQNAAQPPKEVSDGEIRRRVEDIDRGRVTVVPWSKVRRRLRRT